MTRLPTIRRRLLVAFVKGRRVVHRYQPEIKLAALLLTTFIGNTYFDTATSYGVCLVALVRKYRLGDLIGL
jgi:hypothetical protein